MKKIDFSKYSFHPVIDLDKDYEVCDWTKKDFKRSKKSLFSVGKYNEKRAYLYKKSLFKDRNIHMGIDLGAPENSPVYMPLKGEIFDFKDHTGFQNYGPSIITKHRLEGVDFYLLFAHLSKNSLKEKKRGQILKKGEKFAYLGSFEENGNWPTHLHFQITYLKPEKAHIPALVSQKDHKKALEIFPDPQFILGKLY